MAKVFTQLEYMNFEHQYNGQFYLGETANNPNLHVFQAGPNFSPQQTCHLGSIVISAIARPYLPRVHGAQLPGFCRPP